MELNHKKEKHGFSADEKKIHNHLNLVESNMEPLLSNSTN